ncbi:MAG: hypothetical protein IJE90_06615 [Clostridia bacterium]|nr:hypothetical protein [Clostridia bacterium]
MDETTADSNTVKLYGAGSGAYAPKINVHYETSYGINTAYRTHTHELGRFGQGSIDLQCGNLMFESEDFAWPGNRMPVTIKHLYNSALAEYAYTRNTEIDLNTANFSGTKLGNGWKLNLMQSMVYDWFRDQYIYVGENGDEICFKRSEKRVCCDSGSQCDYLYEEADGSGDVYNPVNRTLTRGEDTYVFDSVGRLISVTDADANRMTVTYDAAGRLTTVTDGAGRDFAFSYNADGYLTSIAAPDHRVEEPDIIRYAYTGNLLTGITYPDERSVSISYDADGEYPELPTVVTLRDASGTGVYRVTYTYAQRRVYVITEFGMQDSTFIAGAQSIYRIRPSSRTTQVETVELPDADAGNSGRNIIRTVYTFDDDGNVISQYAYSQDMDNVSVDGIGSGIHPMMGEDGVKAATNITNLLQDHGFRNMCCWQDTVNDSDVLWVTYCDYEDSAKFGRGYLRLQAYNSERKGSGIYQTTGTLPAGEYTFSAYVRVGRVFTGDASRGAYLRVTDAQGNCLGESEHISEKSAEFVRVSVPFTLAASGEVKVYVLMDGMGVIGAEAAQLEKNPYANPYNLLENGSFEYSTQDWIKGSGVNYDDNAHFDMSRSLKIVGDLRYKREAYQTVPVKSRADTRETFTLSGWAKGYGLPDHERAGVDTPTFGLRAVIYYTDGTTEEYPAAFSPNTESWQFASVEFSKKKYAVVDYVRVYCEYGYNVGTAYFDCIQLLRNSLETELTAADFAVDTDEQTTDTTAAVDEEMTQEDTAPTFAEARDCYGNALTETTFTDGEFGTLYRSFGFNPAGDGMQNGGNDLTWEQDARGNKTQYAVDEETSRNEEVIDRCGNKTAYEYDKAGRTTKVTNAKPQYDESGNKKTDENGNVIYDEIATVSYAYDAFDNMTEIVRGDGMKYVLWYNGFHNLQSIGVAGKSENLVTYAYKNGNGRLKQITYANGDAMKATYNGIGQMVAERWYNSSDELTAHYKYVYDGEGNIVRSIDIRAEKEYNYTYEDGKLMRAVEYDVEFADELVTKRTLVNAVTYSYDSEGKLYKKTISLTGQTIYYENPDDGNQVAKLEVNGKTVTSHSKNDSFGRKVFDELQLGVGTVSRQFTYHRGTVTQEHMDAEKVKSTATTNLVSRIALSDGRTLSYEYDAEERITSVTETYTVGEQTVTNTTAYTYDALGQLLTETVNDEVVNSMEYDNYGNIKTKNGVVYTYGDDMWKDLLTAVDGTPITYDAQGNPTSYLGHELTWEKGRQLKSFDSNIYTYNANGIRTSKMVDGIRHDYLLDGSKILREAWNYDEATKTYKDILVPLYDNEESVCGILYNDVPYYFLKNLQGDVIGIVDRNATVVARYTYDAWGKVVSVTDENGTDISYDTFHIANINPFRYRGYYYDTETGLYYVSSRYYDPEIGRWINSDEPLCLLIASNLQQYNICCYCENSPIKNVDFLGYWAVSLKVSSVAVALDLILTLLALSVAFFAPAKALSWSRKIFSWAKKTFNNLINKIAYVLANSLDTIMYELLRKYNSVGKARISIGAAAIAAFISTLIDLTPGNIVAKLIDRFDKDGKSGYIRF